MRDSGSGMPGPQRTELAPGLVEGGPSEALAQTIYNPSSLGPA
jgi:hypothetical protein